ncbi:MAG TPA: hypothetical protein VKT81_23950 [Bryobacteraceae bacterium]|nr:hypothetical protein [Bryobacteraceae bacterium]
MDAELKQTLADMESRISKHVGDLESRIYQHVGNLESRIYQHVDERLEHTETKLLTAFHNWAQTYEVRARGTSAAVREFEERLGMVEERLAKLERGRNGGPQN